MMKITALLLCSDLIILLFGVFGLAYSEEVECELCPCQTKWFTVCGPTAFRAEVCNGMSKCRACGEKSCLICPAELQGRFCTEVTHQGMPRYLYPEILEVDGEGSGEAESEQTFCKDPGADINGYRTARSKEGMKLEGDLKKFPQDASLIYYCKDGYYPTGGKNISCLASGEWSAPRPTCSKSEQRFCEDPGMDINGIRTVRSKERLRLYDGRKKFPQDTQIFYYCRDGYHPIGRQIISCLPSGEWNALPPKCAKSEERFCDDPGMDKWTSFRTEWPPLESFWSAGGRKKFSPDNMLTYYCKNDYHPYRDKSAIWCLASGEWSGPLPRCVPFWRRNYLHPDFYDDDD